MFYCYYFDYYMNFYYMIIIFLVLVCQLLKKNSSYKIQPTRKTKWALCFVDWHLNKTFQNVVFWSSRMSVVLFLPVSPSVSSRLPLHAVNVCAVVLQMC